MYLKNFRWKRLYQKDKKKTEKIHFSLLLNFFGPAILYNCNVFWLHIIMTTHTVFVLRQ